MTSDQNSNALKSYWERPALGKAILDELRAEGKNLARLTITDLDPYDQFHGGGKEMTLMLARSAKLRAGLRILDVGGGLGGPARTLATEFGCSVTVAELTESYIEAGRMLTDRLHLGSKVQFVQSDALNLPFKSNSFDLIWTQNSGMNISDKEKLYSEFHRVLAHQGRLVFQEPMAGPLQPPIYPLMWARDESTNFIRTPDEMRTAIETSGFQMIEWRDLTADLAASRLKTINPNRGIQVLVMGDRIAQISEAMKPNIDERRVVLFQGVFQKI